MDVFDILYSLSVIGSLVDLLIKGSAELFLLIPHANHLAS